MGAGYVLDFARPSALYGGVASMYPSPHARGYRNITVTLNGVDVFVRFLDAKKRLGAKSYSDCVLKLLEMFERKEADESPDSTLG
jgi:hypothetical protein